MMDRKLWSLHVFVFINKICITCQNEFKIHDFTTLSFRKTINHRLLTQKVSTKLKIQTNQQRFGLIAKLPSGVLYFAILLQSIYKQIPLKHAFNYDKNITENF